MHRHMYIHWIKLKLVSTVVLVLKANKNGWNSWIDNKNYSATEVKTNMSVNLAFRPLNFSQKCWLIWTACIDNVTVQILYLLISIQFSLKKSMSVSHDFRASAVDGLQTSASASFTIFLLVSDPTFATWPTASLHQNWIIHLLSVFEVSFFQKFTL